MHNWWKKKQLHEQSKLHGHHSSSVLQLRGDGTPDLLGNSCSVNTECREGLVKKRQVFCESVCTSTFLHIFILRAASFGMWYWSVWASLLTKLWETETVMFASHSSTVIKPWMLAGIITLTDSGQKRTADKRSPPLQTEMHMQLHSVTFTPSVLRNSLIKWSSLCTQLQLIEYHLGCWCRRV